MIRGQNLKMFFGAQSILNNVDVHIKKGLVTGIIGPNGAGKSTLLSILTGGRRPEKGHVFIENQPIESYSYKSRAKIFTYIQQIQNEVFGFSAFDMVMMGRNPYIQNQPNTTDRLIVTQVMNNLGILGLSKKSFTTMSGGERQMTLIARAIVQDTPMIILDEPTSFLDLKNQLIIMNCVRSLNLKENKTILMVLHDLNHAVNYCDEIIILNKGDALQGRPFDLLTEERINEIFEVNAKLHIDNDLMYVLPDFFGK